jgi:hypothetical protein
MIALEYYKHQDTYLFMIFCVAGLLTFYLAGIVLKVFGEEDPRPIHKILLLIVTIFYFSFAIYALDHMSP